MISDNELGSKPHCKGVQLTQGTLFMTQIPSSRPLTAVQEAQWKICPNTSLTMQTVTDIAKCITISIGYWIYAKQKLWIVQLNQRSTLAGTLPSGNSKYCFFFAPSSNFLDIITMLMNIGTSKNGLGQLFLSCLLSQTGHKNSQAEHNLMQSCLGYMLNGIHFFQSYSITLH